LVLRAAARPCGSPHAAGCAILLHRCARPLIPSAAGRSILIETVERPGRMGAPVPGGLYLRPARQPATRMAASVQRTAPGQPAAAEAPASPIFATIFW